MTRRTRLLPPCLLALLVAGANGVSAQEPPPEARILNLSTELRAGALSVSFDVDGAFTPEVMERLRGAVPVTFKHRVRVVRPRLLLPAHILAEVEVVTTAQYDNLTQQYTLARTSFGAPVEIVTTEDESEMRRFMSEVSGLRVAGPEAIGSERRVTLKVRSAYEDTWVLFLLPWTYAATAETEVILRP